MFLSDLSIKQPVFATMMMAALAVLGLASYQALKVDLFPDVEFPVVTVTTRYTGASPETVDPRGSFNVGYLFGIPTSPPPQPVAEG